MNRRGQAGSALIEFAGSLILLTVMFAGIFELGYSFYTYGQLVSAIRAGARYAALQPRGVDARMPYAIWWSMAIPLPPMAPNRWLRGLPRIAWS